MQDQPLTPTRRGGPFGVCAAIGADFGFHPDILRVALAAGLLVNLPAVVGAYLFAALVMVAGRLFFPVAKARPEAIAAAACRMPVLPDHRRPAVAERDLMAA